MKKSFILIVMLIFFVGCIRTGNGVKHESYTRNGEIKIQNLNESWVKMGGSEKHIDEYIKNNGFVLTDIEKDMEPTSIYRITIPIIFTKNLQPYMSAPAIDLCSNGYPSNYDEYEKLSLNINSLDSNDTFNKKNMPWKALILTTPIELYKKGFIDDNNLTKSDLCIYPSINILYNTMKNDDTVRITADEMDKVISEYEIAK